MKLNNSFSYNKYFTSNGQYSGSTTLASRKSIKRGTSAVGRPSFNTVTVDSPKMNNYMKADYVN